jgi:hypothetical protein
MSRANTGSRPRAHRRSDGRHLAIRRSRADKSPALTRVSSSMVVSGSSGPGCRPCESSDGEVVMAARERATHDTRGRIADRRAKPCKSGREPRAELSRGVLAACRSRVLSSQFSVLAFYSFEFDWFARRDCRVATDRVIVWVFQALIVGPRTRSTENRAPTTRRTFGTRRSLEPLEPVEPAEPVEPSRESERWPESETSIIPAVADRHGAEPRRSLTRQPYRS